MKLSKRDAKRQIKRLRKLQDKWIIPLGLKWWQRIEYLYHNDNERFKIDDHVEATMQVTVAWEYMWAEIHCNLPHIATMEDSELEHTFLHELMHIMVKEMIGGKQHHIERVCTKLAQAFVWVRDWEKS